MAESIALLSALKSRDLTTAQALLGGRIDASVADENGRTALHLAAAIGDEAAAVIDRLIARGAVLDAMNFNRITPLQKACMGGHSVAALALARRGADIHLTNGRGESALDLAPTTALRDALIRAAAAQGMAPQAHHEPADPGQPVTPTKQASHPATHMPAAHMPASELRGRLWAAQAAKSSTDGAPSSLIAYVAAASHRRGADVQGNASSGGAASLVRRQHRRRADDVTARLARAARSNLVAAVQRNESGGGHTPLESGREDGCREAEDGSLPRWLEDFRSRPEEVADSATSTAGLSTRPKHGGSATPHMPRSLPPPPPPPAGPGRSGARGVVSIDGWLNGLSSRLAGQIQTASETAAQVVEFPTPPHTHTRPHTPPTAPHAHRPTQGAAMIAGRLPWLHTSSALLSPAEALTRDLANPSSDARGALNSCRATWWMPCAGRAQGSRVPLRLDGVHSADHLRLAAHLHT